MTLAIGIAGGSPAFVAVLLSCELSFDRLEPAATLIGLVGGAVTISGVLIRIGKPIHNHHMLQ